MRTAIYAGSDFSSEHDVDSFFPPMLVAAFERFQKWRRTRKAIRDLSRFSDGMLKDIGITRSDIGDAVRHGRNDNLTHHRT